MCAGRMLLQKLSDRAKLLAYVRGMPTQPPPPPTLYIWLLGKGTPAIKSAEEYKGNVKCVRGVWILARTYSLNPAAHFPIMFVQKELDATRFSRTLRITSGAFPVH